jgi:hypothetical protein
MRVVVIELDENNPYIEPARQAGAAVIIGDAMNPEHLRSAGVHRARYLVLLCGEDAINAEIAIRAKELARERSKGVVTCILQISDPALSELLRSYAFALDEASGLRLEILNFYDIAARSVLKSFPALLSMKDGRTPHIIIVGSGHLGTSLILHASLTWRRLGFGAHNRLRVSLVDPEAGRKAEKLTSRYAWLPQLCSLGAHDMDLLAGELDQDPELNDSLLGEDVSGVCVSLDDDAKSLSVGLMLRDRLRGTQVPIIVRMSDNKGLAKLLQAWDQIDEGRSGVHAFPLLENVCQLDLVLGGIHEVLARAIHDNYVRTQTDLGETSATNPSLVSWEQLSEPLRQMNRAQSRDIGAKLRSIGCAIAPLTDLHAEDFQLTPEELESMSQAEHQRWMQDTRAEGFRYGPGPKDPAGKTHPSLVPWSDLSDGEQEKDRVTTRAIPRLLAMAGLQVYRVRPVESRSPPVLPGGQARA